MPFKTCFSIRESVGGNLRGCSTITWHFIPLFHRIQSPPYKHNIHSVNYSVLHVDCKQKRTISDVFFFSLLHRICPNVYLMPVASYVNMLLLLRLCFMQSSPFYFKGNIVFLWINWSGKLITGGTCTVCSFLALQVGNNTQQKYYNFSRIWQ